jgi:hypothetical protein
MQPGRLYGVAISDIWASVFAALHISHSGIKLCQAHRPPGTARSDIGCHLYLQQSAQGVGGRETNSPLDGNATVLVHPLEVPLELTVVSVRDGPATGGCTA